MKDEIKKQIEEEALRRFPIQLQNRPTKAWGINLDKIDEAYFRNDEIVYSESRGKAKSMLIRKVHCEGFKTKYTREDLTFLNISVVRKKAYDLIEFEGNKITSYNIESIIKERERNKKLDDVLNDSSITHCYILKGNYYRPNYCGYTDFKHRAGVYSKADAIYHVRSVSSCWVEPINNEEHNKMINQEINELQKRLIP
jgi:hypothetical protein